MKRKLFNLAAFFSMLLCIGTGVLWVRSYYYDDSIRLRYSWDQSPEKFSLRMNVASSVQGTFLFSISRRDISAEFQDIGTLDLHEFAIDMLKTSRGIYPVGWATDFYTQEINAGRVSRKYYYPQLDHDLSRGVVIVDERWVLIVPAPYALTAMLFLPLIWLIRKLRKIKRFSIGCCQVCGYDLRATLERCPECGTTPVKVQAASTTSLGPTGGDTSPG